MQEMKDKIIKLYAKDIMAVTAFITFFWIVLIFSITQIYQILSISGLRITIVISGAVVGIMGTASSIAVLKHLKKNRDALYKEELMNLESKNGQMHLD